MSEQNIQLISTELLQPNPFQPRGKMNKEELQDLADSITTYGILEPIVVAHTPAGYQIIAGERRWRAAQLAGLTEIPILLRKTTPKEMLELAIIENVQRVDLNAMERAKAFQQLQRDFGYSVGDISQKMGKSSSYVSNSLRLLNLPDAVKDGLVGGLISEGHARALAGVEDKKQMIELYKIILKDNLNVRDTEQKVRTLNEKVNQVTKAVRGPKLIQVDDEKVQEWQQKISTWLEAKSDIKISRSNRVTKLVITLKGDPETTQKDLEKIMALSD